jgi:hypothetical protein
MSAMDLLRQVKALPARDRQKLLLDLLAETDDAATLTKKAEIHVKWPDVESRAKRIYGNRVLPNLIQLEREESAF